ncbi:argininosuccinate lyase [Pyruvatibacter mobilis]|uniref:argininosuccinate lyase n=1 Tax=Pyruvatibacter mobilis TaxID=1712261 RepID=UPI003BA886B1
MGNKMWGGRFADGPDAIMEAINVSIDFDQRLARQDIAGSRAHAQMLSDSGIITSDDLAEILNGLDQVEQELVNGTFPFRRDLEDIHMNVEARLRDLVGPAAGRLHTARSRNDQVATDFKLHVRERLEAFDEGLKELQTVLVDQAEQHTDTVMPGFTHLQTAQPVTFGHHCLAYVEMLARDRGRFQDAHARAGLSPLGSAALAGTSFPINREQTAKALGFEGPTRNSLDAVADRDFVLETLSAASICAVHLSRLAEEIVIWTSSQFNFVRLPDKFSTGSSIMPQKRNPDAAELVRAKPGRIIGALNSLLIMLKGLPMTYSKDMQEDKEPAFDAMDALDVAIAAMTGMIRDLTVNKDAMRASAGTGFSTATDLADWLVRELNMPFRDAHHVTGSLVAAAEAKGCDLDGLTLEEMQQAEPKITAEVFDVLGLDNSVKSRTSFGGTAPDNVRAQVAYWREQLS